MAFVSDDNYLSLNSNTNQFLVSAGIGFKIFLDFTS